MSDVIVQSRDSLIATNATRRIHQEFSCKSYVVKSIVDDGSGISHLKINSAIVFMNHLVLTQASHFLPAL